MKSPRYYNSRIALLYYPPKTNTKPLLNLPYKPNPQDSGDFNGSLALYLQAIDLKNNLPLAWLNLGLAFTALGREEDAIAAYKVLL